MIRWFWRWLAAALCPLCTVAFAGVAIAGEYLPDGFAVESGTALELLSPALRVQAGGVQAVGGTKSSGYTARVDLFGVIPVKTVQVREESSRDVAVCGMPFGIKMFTDGVLVVGLGTVDTRQGTKSPASSAGLRVGDCIVAINGSAVSASHDVARAIEGSAGHSLTLTVRRQGVTFDATLTPVASIAQKALKAGMWIRDSSAGIGTLTFYDMHTGTFAGLGHPVNDTDTGQTIPLSTGEIVPASIFGAVKGEVGTPGELLGSFEDGSWGLLTTNDTTGLYGILSKQPDAYATMPIAYKQEVVTGAAQLITTVEGTQPQAYDIVIERVDYREETPTRNLVIRVTDERLLEKTGGVLCGMSGSPIVQGGKLVGAVTHVFVSDPTSGYAVFAQTMRETAQTVPATQWKDAA